MVISAAISPPVYSVHELTYVPHVTYAPLSLQLFVICLLIFSMMAHYAIGESVEELNTLTRTIFVHLNMLLGEIGIWEEIVRLPPTQQTSGKVWFWSWLAIAFFILLNVLLAIVVDSYVDMKSEQQVRPYTLACLDKIVPNVPWQTYYSSRNGLSTSRTRCPIKYSCRTRIAARYCAKIKLGSEATLTLTSLRVPQLIYLPTCIVSPQSSPLLRVRPLAR